MWGLHVKKLNPGLQIMLVGHCHCPDNKAYCFCPEKEEEFREQARPWLLLTKLLPAYSTPTPNYSLMGILTRWVVY